MTDVPHSFQITPHSTCSAVCGAHEGVAPVPVEPAVDRGADLGKVDGVLTAGGAQRVPDVVVAVARLADVDDGGLASVPGQDAGVVGLAAAGGVERGAVQGDPVLAGIDGDDDGIEVLQRGVTQVEQLGHPAIVARAPGRPGTQR